MFKFLLGMIGANFAVYGDNLFLKAFGCFGLMLSGVLLGYELKTK